MTPLSSASSCWLLCRSVTAIRRKLVGMEKAALQYSSQTPLITLPHRLQVRLIKSPEQQPVPGLLIFGQFECLLEAFASLGKASESGMTAGQAQQQARSVPELLYGIAQNLNGFSEFVEVPRLKARCTHPESRSGVVCASVVASSTHRKIPKLQLHCPRNIGPIRPAHEGAVPAVSEPIAILQGHSLLGHLMPLVYRG